MDSPSVKVPRSRGRRDRETEEFPTAAAPGRGSVFRREGEYWTIGYAGTAVRLRDTKGLHYIARLLAHPGREIHVADLATRWGGAGNGARVAVEGDLGAVLDPRATAEYKRRLAELREEREEAAALGDAGRAERARAEIELITRELSAAYGLGGRTRRAGDPAERVRKAVTNQVRRTLGRIRAAHPTLGQHLANALRTGLVCVYRPEQPIAWQLGADRIEAGQEPRPVDPPAARPDSARDIFVGRARELGVLRERLAAAAAGQGRMVLLVGEPGIGKTRTAEEFAREARAAGVEVLVGRCYEGEGAPAFWPWRQVLRAYAAVRDGTTLAVELGDGAADVAAICPELHGQLPGLGPSPGGDPAHARFRLFDGVTRTLVRAASTQPLVLVLDDLHGADAPSLLLLQFLARELGGVRLLVVGAFRDVALGPEHPLAEALGELVRERVSERLVLGGLGEPEVAEVLTRVTGSAPPPGLAAAIHARTEGNPLYVIEVVRALADAGQLGTAEEDGRALTVPATVRVAIGRRFAVVSAACRELLTLGAVCGREFRADVLARASGGAIEAVIGTLDEATAARVVDALAGPPGRYRFAHALFGETLVGALSPARRVGLHRQAAEALAADARAGELAAEIAHHYHAAGAAGDPAQAVAWACRAGDRALEQLAHEEAVRLYGLALAALDWPGGGDGATRAEVLLALGEARKRAGQLEEAKASFWDAARIARRLDSAELLTQAALGFAPSSILAEQADPDTTVVHLLEDAIGAWNGRDSGLHARALGRLALTRYMADTPERRDALLEAAVAMGRRIGDAATLRHILAESLFDPWDGCRLDKRFDDSRELVRLAEEADDRESLATAHLARCCLQMLRGDTPGLDRELGALARVAEKLGQPYWLWRTGVVRAARAIIDGRLAEADRIAEDAAGIGRTIAPFSAGAWLAGQRLAIRAFQGRPEEAPGYRAFAAAPAVEEAWIPIAWAESQLGNYAEASRIFDRMAANDFGVLPRHSLFLLGCALLAETCAVLCDAPRAAWLYRALSPYAEQWVIWCEAVSFGPVAYFLGLLARTMGRLDDGARYFEDALTSTARAGARPYAARTQGEYAALLLQRAAPGDAERARALLAEALATAEAIGMAGVRGRAAALLAG